MKNLIQALFATAFILFTVTSCGSDEQEKKDQKQEVEQELSDLKDETKDVGNSIGDLLKEEKGEFEKSAEKVLGDLESKIAMLKEKAAEKKDDADLQEQIDALEKKANTLEEEIKEMDKKAGEEWNQSKEIIKKEFEDLKKEVDNASSEK
mgnify:CR=1 FL=1